MGRGGGVESCVPKAVCVWSCHPVGSGAGGPLDLGSGLLGRKNGWRQRSLTQV